MTTLKRRFRPFSFALMLSLLVVAWQFHVLHTGPGSVLANELAGGFAFIAAALLFMGWMFDSHNLRLWGLLLATGVWAARSALSFMDPVVGISVVAPWLSLCWAIGSFGAWWVEKRFVGVAHPYVKHEG